MFLILLFPVLLASIVFVIPFLFQVFVYVVEKTHPEYLVYPRSWVDFDIKYRLLLSFIPFWSLFALIDEWNYYRSIYGEFRKDYLEKKTRKENPQLDVLDLLENVNTLFLKCYGKIQEQQLNSQHKYTFFLSNSHVIHSSIVRILSFLRKHHTEAADLLKSNEMMFSFCESALMTNKFSGSEEDKQLLEKIASILNLFIDEANAFIHDIETHQELTKIQKETQESELKTRTTQRLIDEAELVLNVHKKLKE